MSEALKQRLKKHLDVIYPDRDSTSLINEIIKIIWPSSLPLDHPAPVGNQAWSEETMLLITYGDTIINKKEPPLKTLEDFLEKHVEDIIRAVHILPFFPYSSDDGFAVKDYYKVREDLGEWSDINRIGNKFILMSDLVINHASSHSEWFKKFKQGIEPYDKFFFTADKETDTSIVIRPRPSPLLIPFETSLGEKHVWCTFGADQVDFDFSNTDVFLEFLRIIKHYLDNDVKIFRLDAVAYLWKEIGTPCIHLEQTHEIIRLIRTLFDFYEEDAIIITETNVPNHENLSYFGNQNEAHMIYNFSLPPLLIQALLTGNEYYLQRWIMSMPPTQESCAYFNFTASHDGIGLLPAQGILMEEDMQEMIDTIRSFGGKISMRSIGGGLERPYEMNIALFDALKGTIEGEDNLQRERFMASQTIMMAFAGVPAFYIHSLLATPNDYEKVEKTKHNRHINRHQWDLKKLEEKLADPHSDQFFALNEIKRLASIRIKQKAFHPNATQFTLQLPDGLFGFWRQSLDRKQDIFCITNITKEEKNLPLTALNLFTGPQWVDLMTNEAYNDADADLFLAPYQTVWITNISS